jgi:hypothetical protein
LLWALLVMMAATRFSLMWWWGDQKLSEIRSLTEMDGSWRARQCLYAHAIELSGTRSEKER